jgi:hypothetical protein
MKFNNSKKSMAFIGSVGVPNCYGGFESFLESVAPIIAESGNRVYVTCDYNRYQDHSVKFRGVERIFIKIPANGIWSPIHDFIAFIHSVKIAEVIVVLGVSAGPFFIAMRCIAYIFNKKLIVNVDGVEWRRNKYSSLTKFILWTFDLLGQLSANQLIYDNKELRPFIHSVFRNKATCIAYSGDHVLRLPNHKKPENLSALTICRIEPENNLEMLIEGVLSSLIDSYVIIGNWNSSKFGIELRNKYSKFPKLLMLDPIYDVVRLAEFRESCAIYLHGHSVGGTNPSLVEMLFYDCNLLCFDCEFNRETAGLLADYCNNSSDFSLKINLLIESLNSGKINKPKGKYPSQYTAKHIASCYLAAAENLIK